MRPTLAMLAALSAVAAAAVVTTGAGGFGGPGGGSPPRILGLEYYEDREDGYRYNVVATIKGRAREVSARSGRRRASGRLSDKISTTGPGKLWFFRAPRFVKVVRHDLAEDGTATVAVLAGNEAGVVRKRCTLELELDPLYGGFAAGDCRRVGR